MKKLVRDAYGKVAAGEGEGCCTTPEFARLIGYSEEDLGVIPGGAEMSLGCGNPIALAELGEGETVLDLGSGGGIDCFLAASRVGPEGRVIGLDMTPEMVERARANARKAGVRNVEFRLGEIEAIPLEDSSVDVVISNCVINLSPDKPGVFREIYRVLRPGGRAAVSDIALLRELPEAIRENVTAYVGCIAGAVTLEEYRRIVEGSGLKDVKVTIKGDSSCITPDTKDPIARTILDGLGDGETLDNYVASVAVEGRKPDD